ncbi:hypothetical protein LS70_005890 [Helicobacter sp. MIT 11-5569]|uniref:type I restriction endonuclease n=1 Tax=Helicobacter sp. MIT 11-5569 TaxID=1548151 RepID=UPI00051FC779|nr:type I restriction endonuclease [Helicobacter sp. MIT 11-5569]TLD83275.1 hypothetical protein LS70_005890 [Helicobacter sp. MIT 11-5569]
MPHKLNEATIESLLLEGLATLGYEYKNAKDLERKGNAWILENEFRESMHRINFGINFNADSKMPYLPLETQERLINEALAKLKALENEELLESNAKCSAYLTQGIKLEITIEGETRGVLLQLIDFQNPFNNHFLACNQLHFEFKMSKCKMWHSA